MCAFIIGWSCCKWNIVEAKNFSVVFNGGNTNFMYFIKFMIKLFVAMYIFNYYYYFKYMNSFLEIKFSQTKHLFWCKNFASNLWCYFSNCRRHLSIYFNVTFRIASQAVKIWISAVITYQGFELECSFLTVIWKNWKSASFAEFSFVLDCLLK